MLHHHNIAQKKIISLYLKLLSIKRIEQALCTLGSLEIRDNNQNTVRNMGKMQPKVLHAAKFI